MSDQSNSSKNIPGVPGALTTPLSLRGLPVWLVYLLSLFGLVYILNPTLGIFELLPDSLPLVGNLDEGVAFLLLWAGLVEFFEGRKLRKAANTKKALPPEV